MDGARESGVRAQTQAFRGQTLWYLVCGGISGKSIGYIFETLANESQSAKPSCTPHRQQTIS